MSDTHHAPEPQTRLSSEGLERSTHILDLLQYRLAQSNRRARAARRSAAATVALGLCAGLVWLTLPRPATPHQHTHGGDTPRPPAPTHAVPDPLPDAAPVLAVQEPPQPRVVVRIVCTTSDPLPNCGTDRIATATPHPAAIARVCILDDRQLLSALTETGGSFGLVRVGERTVVIRDGEPITGDGG